MVMAPASHFPLRNRRPKKWLFRMIALEASGCIFRSGKEQRAMTSFQTFRSVVLTLAIAFLTLVLATRCTDDDTTHARAGSSGPSAKVEKKS
jgi:hypothetical protein